MRARVRVGMSESRNDREQERERMVVLEKWVNELSLINK